MDHPLVGQRVTAVRWMNDDERRREGWDFDINGPPAVVELKGGSLLYASSDPEGNGPGCLFGVQDGQAVYVQPAADTEKTGRK